jgi:putative salt-induced outer membrane protein
MTPLVLNAAENIVSDKMGWKGEGELGFTSTTGNTDSSNLNTSLGLTHETDLWKHVISLETLLAEADGVKSADSLVLKERSEYSLDQASYAFGQARYEKDEFSGYDYQASIVFGVGSRFIDSDTQLLDASAGLGYRQIKDSTSNDSDSGVIITTDLVYEYKISKTATFIEKVLLESGDNNTFFESETALRTRINGNLSAKISYLLKRNSDVPQDIDKTDSVVSVSLVYGF